MAMNYEYYGEGEYVKVGTDIFAKQLFLFAFLHVTYNTSHYTQVIPQFVTFLKNDV